MDYRKEKGAKFTLIFSSAVFETLCKGVTVERDSMLQYIIQSYVTIIN